MPFNPANASPGVYIQEIPSGVRTITGVSTSVTAFVGLAESGSVNEAVHILSFSDYERTFGGLADFSEMSYAVNQFFLNGGNDAWIVGLPGSQNAPKAWVNLKNNAGQDVLKITSLVPGHSGNGTEVQVNYSTQDPSKTFKLIIIPEEGRSEEFSDLSMDKQDQTHFVEMVVNDPNNGSKLVMVKALDVAGMADVVALRPAQILDYGTLTSGTFADDEFTSLPDKFQEDLLIQLGSYGPDPLTIEKVDITGSKLPDQLAALAKYIQETVHALRSRNPAYQNFTCTVVNDKQLLLASGSHEANSSVTLTLLSEKDNVDKLHLVPNGAQNQAIETPGQKVVLKGGREIPYAPNEAYNLFIGDRLKREGIFALESVDLFNLLCLPGITDSGVLTDAIAYCKEQRAFLIVDAPHPNPDSASPGLSPSQMVDYINGTSLPKGDFGTYAAVYYPWIKIPDPLNQGSLHSFGPSGTIAGLYARTDATRGVWKAPAGTDAILAGAQGLDKLLTDGENGSLNPLGVNCLRIFPVFGAVCWGARTVSGANDLSSEYKYIPVRRTALYIEESLYRGLKWVVFEPNDEPLWAQIRLNVGAFMHNLFVKGAFQGRTPKEAYLVKCDKETTTQNDIDLGIVNILVGFAPLKPAEFVIISIQQIAGQLLV